MVWFDCAPYLNELLENFKYEYIHSASRWVYYTQCVLPDGKTLVIENDSDGEVETLFEDTDTRQLKPKYLEDLRNLSIEFFNQYAIDQKNQYHFKWSKVGESPCFMENDSRFENAYFLCYSVEDINKCDKCNLPANSWGGSAGQRMYSSCENGHKW